MNTRLDQPRLVPTAPRFDIKGTGQESVNPGIRGARRPPLRQAGRPPRPRHGAWQEALARSLAGSLTSPGLRSILWAFLLVFIATHVSAAVPLPDHLLYGTIAIDGRPVTRTETGITIEARRSAFGPILASYRMGSLAANGDFYYSLRIPVAKAPDASTAQAVLGQSVVITVRTASGVAHQVTHAVTEPGVALRLDLGIGVDTNGDGVPEGWELATLGTSGANLNRDTDGDGASDRIEYFAGTKPTDPGDVFRIALTEDGANLHVAFRALRAVGTGFEGRSRYYALESTQDPAGGTWSPVLNHSRIPGNGQLLTYSEPKGTNAPTFFRARVWLE